MIFILDAYIGYSNRIKLSFFDFRRFVLSELLIFIMPIISLIDEGIGGGVTGTGGDGTGGEGVGGGGVIGVGIGFIGINAVGGRAGMNTNIDLLFKPFGALIKKLKPSVIGISLVPQGLLSTPSKELLIGVPI
jgi:hypothetical protein